MNEVPPNEDAGASKTKKRLFWVDLTALIVVALLVFVLFPASIFFLPIHRADAGYRKAKETINFEELRSWAQAEAKQARRTARALQEPMEKQTARELFTYIVEQGKKGYDVQRYKGLGEMTSTQLWETTMDPEHRTLLQVRLEDIAETEAIFTTLMGEDVEARRKFIEDNALDVKNLDI